MELETNGNEFTIKGMIQLELYAIRAVIDTENEPREPLFAHVHDNLVALLGRLDRREIAPEYAEIERLRLRELLEQWQRDNSIPPD